MSNSHYVQHLDATITRSSESYGFASVINIEIALTQLSTLAWAKFSDSEEVNQTLKAYFLDDKDKTVKSIDSVLLVNCYRLPPALYKQFNSLHELLEQGASKFGYDRVCLFGYECLHLAYSEAYFDFLGYEFVSSNLRVLNLKSPVLTNIDFPTPTPSLELV